MQFHIEDNRISMAKCDNLSTEMHVHELSIVLLFDKIYNYSNQYYKSKIYAWRPYILLILHLAIYRYDIKL